MLRIPTMQNASQAPFSAKKMFYPLAQFFYQLLFVDWIRLVVAYARYVVLVGILRRMRTFEPATGDIGVNTVHHNMLGLKRPRMLAVDRSKLLLRPLSAIRFSRADPVLCIGPRAEGEILFLMALGFRNIRAIDLISYSPWIDLGDMHALPYRDNEFAATVMGWCLAYSNNRPKAAHEAIRVTRNGGVIAIGVEYTSETAEEKSQKYGYQVCDEDRLESVAEILALFEGSVDRVFFSHDLPRGPCDKWQLMVIFSIKK